MEFSGWIKLYRQIGEHWLWDDKPFSKGQAWIDLLLLADSKDGKFPYKDTMVEGKRGTVYRSVLYLSSRWGWGREKTRRFLKRLEADGMVSVKSTTHQTAITIINYGFFQDSQPTRQATENQQTDNRPSNQSTHTRNKRNKEYKNNNYSVHFEEFWSVYPRKSEKVKAYKTYCARLKDGFSEAELLSAAKTYRAECNKDKREQKYIKLGATFLSASTPFTDYLTDREKGGVIDEQSGSSYKL